MTQHFPFEALGDKLPGMISIYLAGSRPVYHFCIEIKIWG